MSTRVEPPACEINSRSREAMQEVVMNAEERKYMKKHSKYARANGMTPGVYYAHGEGNVNIQVTATALESLVFTSETHVIDLRLADGSSRKCILRDVQFDPITDKPIHFDLQGLKEDEKLTIEVPVVLTGGIPQGVRDGGMLQHFIHKVRISCLPKNIPEKIEIPVGALGINNFVHVRDLQLPNLTVLENAETAIVGVMPPHIIKEETPAEVIEEPKEPELVAKGKKAEEDEEGAEAPKKGEAPKKAEAPKKEEKK
jgi:large subunit ribosomal protein L25